MEVQEYLRNVMSELPLNGKQHIRSVLGSSNAPLPLPRTFKDLTTTLFNEKDPITYHAIEQSPPLKWTSLLNPHNGQRKLAYGLLDFVNTTLHELKCRDSDVYLVYPGASSIAASTVVCCFPDIKILMFDKDPSMKDLIPSILKDKISLFDNLSTEALKSTSPMVAIIDWFTDQTCKQIKDVYFPASKRKYLLFVSDIRRDTDDLSIVKDMDSQMKWILDIGCHAYMVKFRIPYLNESNKEQIFEMYHEMTRGMKRKTPQNKGFPYLQGSLHLQSFGPQRTTELRLMHADPRGAREFGISYYDPEEVENVMSTFNCFYRNHARFQFHDGAQTMLFDQALADDITKKLDNYNHWCVERVFNDSRSKEYFSLISGVKALRKLSAPDREVAIKSSLFKEALSDLEKSDIKLGSKIRKMMK